MSNNTVKKDGPLLNDTETQLAFSKLHTEYPLIERSVGDPLYEGQKYTLVSFIPSKGAQPDKNGLYGMAKVRGAFHSLQEANDRAEWLVKNHDSVHPILTTYMGRPYPLVADTKSYVQETNEVDLKKNSDEIIKEDVKTKRLEDKKIVNEIKEKEKELLKDVDPETEMDPFENYTMLRVKRAHLIFTYKENLEKLEKIKDILNKTQTEIKTYDEQSNEYKQQYMERYESAREKSGLGGFNKDTTETFMKYLDNDEPLENLLK
jgi:hypothetical protein